MNATRAAVVLSVTSLATLAPLPLRGAGARAEPVPVPLVDLHVDLSYRANYGKGTFAGGSGQFVASRLLRAGVRGVVLPLFVPARVSPVGARAEDFESSFVNVLRFIPETPPLALPGCAAKEGAVRTWLAFEGSGPLAGDADAPSEWVKRGVRIFGLVHTSDNALATSSGGTSRGGGLSDQGRSFVRWVHAAGGVVDVSHASDEATDEAVALAAKEGVPIVATHSNARALAPHPRNLTDDQIRAIARTGGVVGVNFHSPFLVPKGRARLADVVRQVKYLVGVGGVDHVAVGSDFEGDITAPDGLSDVRDLPHLSAALEASGMSRADVEKVFSANALRVLCRDGRDRRSGTESAAPVKK